MTTAPAPAPDAIDQAAGLNADHPLHAVRRQRATVVEHTQASHDALLGEPVQGLTTADRLRVAVACCEAAQAPALAAHYQGLLAALPAAAPPSAALDAMQAWSRLLTLQPRDGDRAALQTLKTAGLDDPAIVALAQLVAFLSYQTRVVAGLQALLRTATAAVPPTLATDGPNGGPPPAAGGTLRLNGFTNATLGWRSWLHPLSIPNATPQQLAVLDESHPQARQSDYYLTLIHQPVMLRHRSVAYNAIMYAPGGLPRAERELGALIVSVTNGCVYCTSVHAQRYAQLARRTDTVEQAFRDPSSAGSTPREQAIARFAQAVTLRPQALDAADIGALRAQGLDDVQIVDLLHATAIFGWANRLMHNLGEPVEAG